MIHKCQGGKKLQIYMSVHYKSQIVVHSSQFESQKACVYQVHMDRWAKLHKKNDSSLSTHLLWNLPSINRQHNPCPPHDRYKGIYNT